MHCVPLEALQLFPKQRYGREGNSGALLAPPAGQGECEVNLMTMWVAELRRSYWRSMLCYASGGAAAAAVGGRAPHPRKETMASGVLPRASRVHSRNHLLFLAALQCWAATHAKC